MISPLAHRLDAPASAMKRRVLGFFAFLVAGNIAAWAWALMAFHDKPVLLGTALLAYSFGLRHAFDADHIAAIDNVTRKLMEHGERPVSAGFFFSLGHSTVVVALTLAIAATATLLTTRFDWLAELGSLVGTSVSAGFLLLIAFANLIVFIGIYKAFRAARAGRPIDEADVDGILARRGLLGRVFHRLFGLISKSWHMYPLGVLFGLGFDTATEIGLLGISATQVTQGVDIWSILVFPALFTAGMALVDTVDGVLMIGAYGWAFVRPVRKLYYNMTVTLVSVVVAFVIGGIEVLTLIGDRLSLEGPFWSVVAAAGDHFGLVGYAIVGLFVGSWLISWLVYRLRGYDRLDATIQG
ncbi:MAG TPA: HoxN/HupN/NixA family nickel/cobalt transporter [Devosiaceae bacterium]